MKTLARATIVLVVLGFCLPSYGQILVCKATVEMIEDHLGARGDTQRS